MMRFIPTRVHGMLDYVVSVVVATMPWWAGTHRHGAAGAETWVPVLLGAGGIVYSLLTNYELGLVRVLPMRAHLALDFANGALLAASPWLFGFRDRGVIPYVALGVMELLVTISTRTTPGWDAARPATATRTAAAGGRRS